MNFLKLAAASILGFGLVAGPAHAALIDFSTLNEGEIVGNEVGLMFDLGDGLTGTLTSSLLGSNATGDIVAFDTSPGSVGVGNDGDLASPFVHVNDATDIRDFGTAIILQEVGAVGPDDAASGGQITFTFDTAVEFVSVAILDGADNGANVQLFLDDVLAISGLGGGDNEFDEFIAGVPTLINSFSVRFGGSGAIGQFEINPASSVPAPPALALLLLGLVGLGAVQRRRRIA